MNKKYANQLYRLFEQELQTRWPQFQKSKQKPDLGRAYVWSVDDVGNVFLFLWSDPKGREQFFCEFGWSSAQYPTRDQADYSFPLLEPKSAFAQPEMIAGIQRLWGDNDTGAWRISDPVDSFEPLNYAGDPEARGKEFVRRVNEQAAMTKEEAARLVRPVVKQLFERLESDVMPYLLEYIEFARSDGRAEG